MYIRLFPCEFTESIKNVRHEKPAIRDNYTMALLTRDDQQLAQSPRLLAKDILALVLSLIVALLLQVVFLNFRVILYDEGLSLYGALRVFHGQLPYRDFWTMYPPGQFYLYAAAFRLFGIYGFWDRVFFCLFNAVSAVAILSILHTLTGRLWLSRFAVVAILLWICGNASYGFPIYPSLAFIFIATACMLARWRGGSARWTLAAGAALGLAALFRHDLALYSLLALAAASVIGQARSAKALRDLHIWSDALRLVCLAVLVVAPVIIMLLLRVPLHDLYYSLLYVPGVIYPKVRSIPFPHLHQVLHGFLHVGHTTAAGPSLGDADYNIVWLPLLTVAIALPWLVVQLRDRDLEAWKASAYLALFLLTGLLFIKGIISVHPTHLTPSIVPAVMLIVVLIANFKTLQPAIRAGLLFTIAWGLLSTIGALRRDYGVFRDNLRLLNPANSYGSFASACHPQPGLERAKCLILDAHERQAILFLQSRTAPGEPIFVGVPRYDVLFDDDIGFYFFSGRESATKWYDLHPGVETTAPIQQEIIASLDKNRVRYIVQDDWLLPVTHNASDISSGVTLLSDYIRQNYTLEHKFDDIEVLRRVTPLSSAGH